MSSIAPPDPAVTNWVPLGYGASVQLNAPSCKAVASTGASLPNAAWTAIVFDRALWDTNNIYAAGTRLTCRTAGKYVVNATAGLGAAAGGQHRLIAIRVNNGMVASSGVVASFTGTTGAHRLNTTGVVDLQIGDYLDLVLYQDSGAALSVYTGDTGFGGDLSITYIGPSLFGRGQQNFSGTYLLRPAANTVPQGTTYFATDTYGTWLSDGTQWILVNQGRPFVTSATMSAAPFTTPYNDQEITLIDSGATYIWHLKYNASDGTAYKWYCIGGVPLTGYTSGSTTINTTGTWTNVSATTIIPPRTGNYVCEASLGCSHPSSGATAYMIMWIGSLPSGAFGPAPAVGWPSAGGYSHIMKWGPFLAQLTGGSGVGVACQNNVAGGSFGQVQWSIMPQKVS